MQAVENGSWLCSKGGLRPQSLSSGISSAWSNAFDFPARVPRAQQ
jgi:hypothetical protein